MNWKQLIGLAVADYVSAKDRVESFGCTILTKKGRHIEVGYMPGEGGWINVDGRAAYRSKKN